MGLLDRRLTLLLALVALTGLAIALPRVAEDAPAGAAVLSMPSSLDGWMMATGAPEDVLPRDPRAIDAARATYVKDGRTVFVGIGRYRQRNDPDWRPSINLIAPEHGVASVTRESLTIGLGGGAARPLPVNFVSVRQHDGDVSVLYWYQVGRKTMADTVRLRLALLANALLLRGQEVWLVRIATSTAVRPADFVRTFHPWLVKALSP